jgi:ubiquinone/menaquinone biosynthesis C-methylase UbiE
MITCINPFTQEELDIDPNGLTNHQKVIFPYINGAYRVIKQENNYTDNFGKQWNKFRKTQIDKFSNTDQSYKRFFASTNWNKENLTGHNILEVGSGAGRFSQIVLDHTTANLYSVDYSNAVSANFINNGPHERLKLFQASIYELPFKNESFDKVFCFGVLQHTPEVKKSIQHLADMVKPGGELIVDFYPYKGWYTKIHAKYIFRPFTTKINQDRLLKIIKNNIKWMIALSDFFTKIGIGKYLNRFIPICDIKNTMPNNMTKEELEEWCVLDTFDMFSPAYDQPQKIEDIVNLFKQIGLAEVWGGYITYQDTNQVAIVKGKKT